MSFDDLPNWALVWVLFLLPVVLLALRFHVEAGRVRKLIEELGGFSAPPRWGPFPLAFLKAHLARDGIRIRIRYALLPGARLPYLAMVMSVRNERISADIALDPLPRDHPAMKVRRSFLDVVAPRDAATPHDPRGAHASSKPAPPVVTSWDAIRTLTPARHRERLLWLRNAGGWVHNRTVGLIVDAWGVRVEQQDDDLGPYTVSWKSAQEATDAVRRLVLVAKVLGPPDLQTKKGAQYTPTVRP